MDSSMRSWKRSPIFRCSGANQTRSFFSCRSEWKRSAKSWSLGVADEAGIELDRPADQRAGEGDESVWNTSTSEEGLRNLTLRTVDRVDSNSRGSIMLNFVEPIGLT